MKKILLLGGSAQQVIAIETAKKLGYYTVLCDFLTDNPGQYVADKTAWLNAMYTDVYEYSGKYSNLDALSRFIEYLKFYDEATDYMEVEGMIQDLHEIWYDFDIETLTEEDAGVYVDRVIQMAEANGAEIQIW